ncbi:MAG: aminoglycoside phosphotransferase family protein [Patescibacteria group bacterium]
METKYGFKENTPTNQLGYLHAKFGRLIQATPYTRGVVNSMWLVKEKNREIIVRFYPVFFQDKLPVETWVLKELRKCVDKTPELLELDIDGYLTPVLFLAKLPGVPWSDVKKEMSRTEYRSLFSSLQELLQKASTIPVNSIGYLHDPVNVLNISQYVEKSMGDYLNIVSKENLLPLSKIHYLQEDMEYLQTILLGRLPRLTYPDLSAGNILISDGSFSGLIDWDFVMGFEPMFSFGNLLLHLSSDSKNNWMDIECFFESIPSIQSQELVLLAEFRAAELLSYLPSTKLFGSQVIKKRLEDYNQALNKLHLIVKY